MARVLQKNKYLILAIYGLLLVLFWVKYFKYVPQPAITINNDPLVSVLSHPSVDQNDSSVEARAKENLDNLKIVSDILPIEWPLEKRFIIDNAGVTQEYADKKLIFASDRDTFFNYVTILDDSSIVGPANSVASILDDSTYQKYASISEDSTYDIYLELSLNPSSAPREVIINNKPYQLVKRGQFYEVEKFSSGHFVAIGIKPADSSFTIKQAVLTMGATSPPQLNRATVSTPRISGDVIDFNIPKKSFILLEDKQDNSYLNNMVQTRPFAINFYSYQALGSDISRIDLRSSQNMNFIAESGRYRIFNQVHHKQGIRLFELSLISLLALLAVIFFYQVSDWVKRIITKLKLEFWQPLRHFLTKNIGQVLAFMALIIVLLVVRLNPVVSNYLTPTNLLALIFLGSIIISRFSINYISSLAISLLVIMAGLVHMGYLDYGEKVGQGTFVLVVILMGVLYLNKHRGKE